MRLTTRPGTLKSQKELTQQKKEKGRCCSDVLALLCVKQENQNWLLQRDILCIKSAKKNPIFFSRLFDYFITCLLIKFKTDLKVTPLNNLGQGFDSPFHQKIKFNDQLYSTPFSWLLKKVMNGDSKTHEFLGNNQIIHFWMNNCLVWTPLWLF